MAGTLPLDSDIPLMRDLLKTMLGCRSCCRVLLAERVGPRALPSRYEIDETNWEWRWTQRAYHPDQHGSASIKSVLPVLTGRSYADLEIHEGGVESLEYLRVHFGDVLGAERQRVRRQLGEYCGQDTEGMVWIVEALRRLVG